MTQAEQIIQACHDALDSGTLGAYLRRDAYKALVSCGREAQLKALGVDLSLVKTSCAVFCRAILHAAGRPVKASHHIGQGIFNGWLEGLSPSHPAWEDAVDKTGKRRQPPPGGIFYRAYSKSSPGTESHVGIFVFEATPGMWITAEGGGSLTTTEAASLTTAQALATNGTVCRLSAKPKDVWAKDSLGRVLVGWFRPELLDGFTGLAPTVPEPAKPEVPKPVGDTPAKVPYTDKHIRAWQAALGVTVDGLFGPATLAASLAAKGKG